MAAESSADSRNGTDSRDGKATGSGQVWLVTGSSRGIGRSLSTAALAAGHRVVLTARDPGDVRDLVDAHPETARAVALDVTDADAAQRAVDTAVAEFGRLDVVVNNAGAGHRGAVEEVPDADLRTLFDTNLFGMLNVTRAALPVLRAQRSGHLVQMSSVAGVVPLLGDTGYAATKFALEGLSAGLADEVRHLGIKVTIVELGPFRTDFLGSSLRWAEPMPDYEPALGPAQGMLRSFHGRQPGDPDRAAQVILRVVAMPDPPLRLPVGEIAFTRIRAHLEERLAELATVEPFAADTSFTG